MKYKEGSRISVTLDGEIRKGVVITTEKLMKHKGQRSASASIGCVPVKFDERYDRYKYWFIHEHLILPEGELTEVIYGE